VTHKRQKIDTQYLNILSNMVALSSIMFAQGNNIGADELLSILLKAEKDMETTQQHVMMASIPSEEHPEPL
jgi:hypothetical protein